MSVLFIAFCRVEYPLAGTRRCKLTCSQFDAGLRVYGIIESLAPHERLSALCVRATAQKIISACILCFPQQLTRTPHPKRSFHMFSTFLTAELAEGWGVCCEMG